jgi:hypothetical protein
MKVRNRRRMSRRYTLDRPARELAVPAEDVDVGASAITCPLPVGRRARFDGWRRCSWETTNHARCGLDLGVG